jgi:ABC-type sugar transport system permease subunit
MTNLQFTLVWMVASVSLVVAVAFGMAWLEDRAADRESRS